VIVSSRPGENTFGERLETQESLRDTNLQHTDPQHHNYPPAKQHRSVQDRYQSFLSGEAQMKFPGAATSALMN